VYVRDRRTGVTERASVSSTEQQTISRTMDAAMSSDGRYVVFSLTARFDEPPPPPGGIGPLGVYVRDRVAGTTHRVSDGGLNVAISANGRTVGFSTPASLVPGDTNGDWDAYVADWQTGHLELVSNGRPQENGTVDSNISLNTDGSLVAFDSNAPDLVAGDTNFVTDVFVRDRRARTTTRISVSSSGTQGDDFSALPSMSGDGRYVAFASFATNLRPGGTPRQGHAWLRDRTLGTTTLVTVDRNGAPASGLFGGGDLSADGRYVAFTSESANLVPGDTNGVSDVFLRDMSARTTTRVSVSTPGAQGNGPSREAAVSAHGAHIAFTSEASNLVPHDTNDSYDVFIRNLGR
jgi:Tol biopolymer transport system component